MELNPDYLEIAEALDHEHEYGHVRGKLHGIPFLVKDNIRRVTPHGITIVR